MPRISFSAESSEPLNDQITSASARKPPVKAMALGRSKRSTAKVRRAV